MLPIAEVHRLAALVPPHAVTAALLLLAAGLALAFGTLRAGRSFTPWLPAVVFVGAASAACWPLSEPRLPAALHLALLVVAGVALMLHVPTRLSAWVSADEPESGASGPARVYLAIALAVGTVLLFDRLGSYYGILVAWEAPVVEGFADAYIEGQSIAAYTARRFLWDDGVLSGGQTSLLYGAPTYALFHLIGFTPLALRLAAPVATILCTVAIYALGGRFLAPAVGAILAVAFALNPAVLFYGRYGSSPAATALAVVLALYTAWLLVERRRPAWWTGLLCAGSFFVATLHYAPARLVVLILLGLLVLTAIWRWRTFGWQRTAAVGLVVAAAGGAWNLESRYSRQGFFLHARGEQFFALLNDTRTIEELTGGKLPNPPQPGQKLPLADTAWLLSRFLRMTIPQYAGLLLPRTDDPQGGAIVGLDPPPLPLYYAPAFPFILLGIAYSVARMRNFPHLSLLAWVGGATVPLLLTNRVDAHRLALFVIPLSVWTALGLREAARGLQAARVPVAVQHALAVALLFSAAFSDVFLLHVAPAQIPRPPAAPILGPEIAGIGQPVVLGWDWDNREQSLVQLEMLERMRREPGWRGIRMPQGLRAPLQAEGGEPGEIYVRQLQQVATHSTAILAPAARFTKAAAAAQRRGLRVAERGTRQFSFYRIDSGAATTGVPDEAVRPLPPIVIPSTPTPIPLDRGPQVSLNDLPARDIVFEFAPPRMDRAWDGGPLRMAGIVYPHGIGVHAACRLTFDVPPRATALQAIVGLSDQVKDCDRASVTFEVRDQNNNVLYDSGLIDATSPVTPIRVPLHDATAVTLAVTDAGNGIDCDHANWALPAFLLAGP